MDIRYVLLILSKTSIFTKNIEHLKSYAYAQVR